MVVRCAARPVVHSGARGGAREPASCGLTAACFALSRKCHARDYSAVGCGDERDLSERCDDDGRGEGESRVVGWQGGSCERHRPVVRCIIDPIERRGEMRARWDARCAPIDTNSRNSFDGTGLRRIAGHGGTFAASVLSRANDAIRNRTTPAIVSQDAAAASTSAASVGGSRKHTRYHVAYRRTRERKSGCSRRRNSVRFGRRIEKAHARPVPQLRTPPPPQLRPLRSARRESACATSAHRSCARSPSARCGAGGARRAAS